MRKWLDRRGLLATASLVAIGAGFGACSDEGLVQQGLHSVDAGVVVMSSAEDVLPTPGAEEHFEQLSARFVTVPAPPPTSKPVELPKGVIPPKPVQIDLPAPTPKRVLRPGISTRFKRANGRLHAIVDRSDLGYKYTAPADVQLPLTADEFVRVQPHNTSFGVEFAAQGVQPGEAQVGEGVVTYRGAAAGGGDVVLRVINSGVEDFVVLEERPDTPVVEYRVNVSEVPGLRWVENRIEFLTESGDPRLRIKPPQIIDANGKGHPAQLKLEGCAADTNPAAPWGRPVTAPGKDACIVKVIWDDTNVVYPAIVDPVWATAADLGTARYRHGATRLSTGYTLVCGGIGDLGIAIDDCELFNPAGGTGGSGSWAATTAMGTARDTFYLTRLEPSDDVLASGGTGLFTSEKLSGSTWTPSINDFSAGYFNPPMPALTSDGVYVVMIDAYGYPYKYTVSTNTWSGPHTQIPLGTPYRYSGHIFPIPGQGTVMRFGGYYSSTTYNTAYRYKPSTDSWVDPGDAASMTVPRQNALISKLDNNSFMVLGGYTGALTSKTAEIYDAVNDTWTLANGQTENGLQQYYPGRSSAFHGSGKLFISGENGLYLFDPLATQDAFTRIFTSNYNFSPFYTQGTVTAAGAKVLMVPVNDSGGGYAASAAARLFDFGEKGAFCSTTAECQDGLTCVQDTYNYKSVCCDTDCTNPCDSCQAVAKTSGMDDGTCGPRRDDIYVGSTACPYEDPSTCGTTGSYCDGAGSCEYWDTSWTCANGSCLDSDTQYNQMYCDGTGSCPTQTTTDCDPGYQCNYGSCLTYCYNDTDYCLDGYYCWDFSPYNYTCEPKKSDGSACSYSKECQTGYCVDGVCCGSACNGKCEACSNARTGKPDGDCEPIPADTDPQNECSDLGPGNCSTNGLCDGNRACAKYPDSTVCRPQGCASATAQNEPDLCASGVCTDSGTTSCSAGYACVSNACRTNCTSDAHCVSNYYCDTNTNQCVADKTQGSACSRDTMCQGNDNCVDGVCCDSLCDGTCRSCLKNQTGLANDGICGNILDDTDPGNECTRDSAYPNSCAEPGLCNGQGACRPYAKDGVQCEVDECTGSTLTTYSCNGAGTCKAKATQCYPFTCDEANAVCKVACTDATTALDCVEGSTCVNGNCVGQFASGTACIRDDQCDSGFCANVGVGALEGDPPPAADAGAPDPADIPGVCCDAACQGTCYGCKASIKGYGSDGVCEAVKNNTDPAGDCEPAEGDPCGLDGQCNGSGACRLAPSGSACGMTSCQGNSVLGQSCNGQGDCINNQGGVDCAPYLCQSVMGVSQCTNPCTDDAACQDGYYCSEGICSKKLANGKACEESGLCDSGYCVDGVCCDASCNGQCEACDVAGSEGVCTPVQGEPHGNRAACDFAGEECGGRCDGVNASSCKYPPTGTECGTPKCKNGLATSSACDGQGACKDEPEVECSPYTCANDATCKKRCNVDDDCSQGYACDETTQRCLPSAVAAKCSDDRLTSIGQNGDTPCRPFLCVPASGTCAVSCAFTTDCAPDFVCESSTKTCLPKPPPSETSGDEGVLCSVGAGPRRDSRGAGLLGLLGLGLVGLVRGRRRRHPQPRSNCPDRQL